MACAGVTCRIVHLKLDRYLVTGFLCYPNSGRLLSVYYIKRNDDVVSTVVVAVVAFHVECSCLTSISVIL